MNYWDRYWLFSGFCYIVGAFIRFCWRFVIGIFKLGFYGCYLILKAVFLLAYHIIKGIIKLIVFIARRIREAIRNKQKRKNTDFGM